MIQALGRLLTRLFGNTRPRGGQGPGRVRRPSPPREVPFPRERPPVQLQVTHVTTGPDGRYVDGVFTPLDVKDTGDGIWVVESESSPGRYYTVVENFETGWECSCPDYERGRQGWKRGVRTCKHIAIVIVKSGRKPALKQVIRSTGEIVLVNDTFLDWYVSEGVYER